MGGRQGQGDRQLGGHARLGCAVAACMCCCANATAAASATVHCSALHPTPHPPPPSAGSPSMKEQPSTGSSLAVVPGSSVEKMAPKSVVTLRHVFSSASRFFSSSAPMVCGGVGGCVGVDAGGRRGGCVWRGESGQEAVGTEGGSQKLVTGCVAPALDLDLELPQPAAPLRPPPISSPHTHPPARCALCRSPPHPSCASAPRTPAPPSQTSASPSCSPAWPGPRWWRRRPRTRQTPAGRAGQAGGGTGRGWKVC